MTDDRELARRVLEHFKEVVGDRVFDTTLETTKFWFSNFDSSHGQWDLLSKETQDFLVSLVVAIQNDMKAR